MFKFSKRCSSLVYALICALFSLNIAANELIINDRKVEISQYKWFGDVPKAKLVRVINPYGDVNSRSSLGNAVELSSAIQKIGDNPPEHKIDIKDVDGVTEIVISYPKDSIRDDQGRLTGRFDLGVWLPSLVRLEVETDFGDIKIKKSASDVIAKSNTGKISIGTSGHVEATSEHGNIMVDFYGERFRQKMKVVSRFGDVKVSMSQDTRLVLNASAAKAIKNNFDKYQAIEVSGDKHQLSAQITKPTKHKIQPVELYLAANKGSVDIKINDESNYKVRKTQPSFMAKDKLKEMNNTKNKPDGQSNVNSPSELATVD